jgi:(p)ppGpp synthase/HD superfamily hydrolase
MAERARKPEPDNSGTPPLTDLRQHGYARIWPQLANQLIVLGWSEQVMVETGAAFRLSLTLFGSLYRANGAPFVSHTIGSASILAIHGAPTVLVQGALLHAAYTNGKLATPLRATLNAEHRKLVARQVGSGVEEIIRNYRRYPPSLVPVPEKVDAYEEDVAAVILIRAANHLEEMLDFGLSFVSKAQKRGQSMLAHARLLLPALGYDRLWAEIEAAERLSDGSNIVPAALQSVARATTEQPSD